MMNEELEKLYIEFEKTNMINKIENKELSNPLYIRIPDEDTYVNSPIKIMFFGQETNDWEQSLGKPLEHLLDVYDGFFGTQIGVYEGEKYNTVFWQYINELSESIKNISDKKCEYLWNNVIKVGKANDKGRPSDESNEIWTKFSELIAKEISILKPNIVIFFTGPNYDEEIKRAFKSADFQNCSKNISERELSKIVSDELPKNTFRTYHPGFLNRNRAVWEKIKKMVIKEIENQT